MRVRVPDIRLSRDRDAVRRFLAVRVRFLRKGLDRVAVTFLLALCQDSVRVRFSVFSGDGVRARAWVVRVRTRDVSGTRVGTVPVRTRCWEKVEALFVGRVTVRVLFRGTVLVLLRGTGVRGVGVTTGSMEGTTTRTDGGAR